ncbi:hypothetical protein ACFVGY_07645 [Streptomyces sp. NPDC127106]|uniref:hypothetical protein n=1 Tax=Streptomyces sp. NPDC127106 TaxID=3345360 RepID=UPI00363DE50B
MEDIVTAAAASLVQAMATDAWQQAREGVVALWRRARPGRQDPAGQPEDGARTERELDAELVVLRSRLAEARHAGDTAAEEALAADWRDRFRELLLRHPELVGPIRQLTEEIAPAPGAAAGPEGSGAGDGSGSAPTVTNHVRDHGTVYVAARDMTVNIR